MRNWKQLDMKTGACDDRQWAVEEWKWAQWREEY